MINKNQLLTELNYFTGSEVFYKNPLFPMFRYTEGVRHLAMHAKCYWLLTDIFAYQIIKPFTENPFQVWQIKVTPEQTATIQVEDGNGEIIKTISLNYTNFPLDDFTLWFIEGTLLLPSEY